MKTQFTTKIRINFWVITMVLLFNLSLPISSVMAETSKVERPKIGIALGGGGALGLAHIGVLKWLEENRIPIDYVAGTSMGGLIGGCYATGMSAEEIEVLLKNIDWYQLFDSMPPLRSVNFRRKEDRRNYFAELEIGYRDNGFKLPQGLAGYRISLLLSRIALPYSSINSFDELPIPYRCVSADINHDEVVVMSDGSLAEAMRATMAVPGVFTPVKRDGRLLIDGGIFDNVPTDVTKQMGADVIIAVHLKAKRGKTRSSENSNVLLSTIDSILENNSRRSLGIADVVLDPQMGNLNEISWKAIEQFITYGYQAAAMQAEKLKKYSLNEADWQKYLQQRNQRKRMVTAIPTDILVLGASSQNASTIRTSLQAHLGRLLEPIQLEADLTDIMGSSLYESLRYEFQIKKGIPTLVIYAIEKPNGSLRIDFALNMSMDDQQGAINPRFRVTAFNISGPSSELRTDFGVGSELYFATELYKPLFTSNSFVAPFLKLGQTNLDMYDNSYPISSYQNNHSEAGLDLGYIFGKTAELRVGYALGNQDLRQQSGQRSTSDLSGSIRRIHLKWNFNNTDEMMFPEKGLDWKLETDWYDQVPGSQDPLGQVETQFIKCFPVATKDMIFTMLAAGNSFQGIPSWVQQFRLGGPFRLGCYNINELSGNNYLLENIGYLKFLGELPLTKKNIYLGLWYENGGVFESWSNQNLKDDLSVGLLSATIFGQIYIGISYGDGNNRAVNFMLGHIF
jgi:NTE family protein